MRLEVDMEKRLGAFTLSTRFETEDETFALLGASGCGKTMTLKCIAGIEKPDRGRIVLGDRVLYDSDKKVCLPARERGIGYLFQDYALFPNMTVRQNVCCATRDGEYAEELIRKLSLENVTNQYPAELSGGQAQRTALARMLVTRPKVLLLDEPFSALDNYLRTKMELVILELLEEHRGPAILVTHDRNEAYRMAGKIGVMDAGRIVEQKGRREFFDHPETVAAARLTGCKNISRVQKMGGGHWFARDWGFEISVGKKGVPEGITHIGYRAHYFRYAAKQAPGAVSCRLQRVIEDTFSVAISFLAGEGTAEAPDALLTWVTDLDTWNDIKEQLQSGLFWLQLDEERILFLRNE